MVNNIYNIKTLKQQRGVVLVVSLVFLIALTAVAAALMQNTTTDMKMSGASEEKVAADQCAVSAVDEFIYKQTTGGSGNNDFEEPVITFQAGAKNVIGGLTSTKTSCDINTALLDLDNNPLLLEVPCPRSKGASSVGEVGCNALRIQISRKYGRNNTSSVDVNSGIVQEFKL
jgi:hypothetical protein